MCEWLLASLLLSTIGVVLVPTLPVAKHLPFASLALDVPRPGGRARRHIAGQTVYSCSQLFDDETQCALKPPQKKELSKLLKAIPVSKQLFGEVGERARYDAARSGGPVDESTFRAQLQHFTWGLFADWDAELWENVLLAGGAVLGSLLPAPPDYKDLRPLDGNGGASWCEFDLYSSFSSSCMLCTSRRFLFA